MEMIGKNRHREQVNSMVRSLRFQLLFNPNLAVVEVLSRDGIESSKYLPKRTSSYPALPPRLNEVPKGKSTTSLKMRVTNPPAFTCAPLLAFARFLCSPSFVDPICWLHRDLSIWRLPTKNATIEPLAWNPGQHSIKTFRGEYGFEHKHP